MFYFMRAINKGVTMFLSDSEKFSIVCRSVFGGNAYANCFHNTVHIYILGSNLTIYSKRFSLITNVSPKLLIMDL